MSDSRKIVRVFISSTFRDMHAERDHLVTVVFPDPSTSLRAGLRERVEQLGLEFFDVNLPFDSAQDRRWGVPAKDANGEITSRSPVPPAARLRLVS